MTMYDERVAELEHLLEKAHNDHAGVLRMYENANKRYQDDTNILASVLYSLTSEYGVERHHLEDAMSSVAFPNEKITQVLQFHEAVPSELLEREYEVTMIIPVSITLTVTATDEDQAEEIAADQVERNGLDSYYMDYNLHYDAEYEVNEV
jgi:hypothetical protein